MTRKMDRHALPKTKTKGQRQRVLDTLLDGIHLSEIEAIHRGLGTSMRSRVSELRRDGYKIEDFRPLGTYKVYFISEENINKYRNENATQN